MHTPPPPWPFDIAGSPEHPPLIFLHGFLGAGRDWLPIAQALSPEYCCVLVDLPGHGRHLDVSLETPFSLASWAEGLARTLDVLPWPQVTAVGYSMGGRLALYAALAYPERFTALVLESANPGLVDPAARAARARLDARRAAEILAQGLPAFLERWYAMPLFHTLHRAPERLAALQAARAHNHPASVARVIRDLSPGLQPALWSCLGALVLPVLLLAGEDDQPYAAIIREMGAAIPHARVRLAPQAGHNIHWERPPWFVAALRDFCLSQGSSRRPPARG